MPLRYAIIVLLLIISFASPLMTETADSYDHTVYQVQKILKDLGYDPGQLDGIWGNKTALALKGFQQDNGLPMTGELDEQTKANLSILKSVSKLSLIEVVKQNDIDKVKALLDAGADVNARDKLGETPLHVAAVRGYRKTSALLIANGANVNAKDERDLTPLHAAAWGGHQKIVTLLLSEGAYINARDEDGVTALHTAALAGRKDTVALLIEKGASIGDKNKDGMTPLHAAALSGNRETVALLIARGADVSAQSKHGITPLDAASQKGYWSIVELLQKQGSSK